MRCRRQEPKWDGSANTIQAMTGDSKSTSDDPALNSSLYPVDPRLCDRAAAGLLSTRLECKLDGQRCQRCLVDCRMDMVLLVAASATTSSLIAGRRHG